MKTGNIYEELNAIYLRSREMLSTIESFVNKNNIKIIIPYREEFPHLHSLAGYNVEYSKDTDKVKIKITTDIKI